jgi:hypothetical protein
MAMVMVEQLGCLLAEGGGMHGIIYICAAIHSATFLNRDTITTSFYYQRPRWFVPVEIGHETGYLSFRQH